MQKTRIAVSHFKTSEVVLGAEGHKALDHSSGIVILIPQSSGMSFRSQGLPLPIPPGVAVLLDGDAENILGTQEGFHGELLSVPVIEISAIVNRSSRLKDMLVLPTILDRQASNALSAVYTDLLCNYPSRRAASPDEDVTLHIAAGHIVNLILTLDDDRTHAHSESGQQKLLRTLRQYMVENLKSHITTADMAARLNMSRQHFSAWAKRMLGSAPARYLRNLRLERSLEILANSNDTMESIAEQLSFTDRYHYSKLFKEKYGYTPIHYRKKLLLASARDLHSQCEALFHNQQYEKAGALCRQGLDDPSFETDRDRLLILLGRSLVQLGQHAEALDAWQSVQQGSYALQAGLLRCRLLFGNDRTDQSLAELERLWSGVQGWKYSDLIQVWVEQASALYTLRKAAALRRYLAFRRDRFKFDQQSQSITIHACRNLGDYLDVLEQCPDLKEACALSLIRAGEYERAFKQYGSGISPGAHARMLVETGRYEDVLALHPEFPDQCCRALIALGRPEEAIERFPKHAAPAYLALGRYQELLDDFPDMSISRIDALSALGRTEELQNVGVRGSHFWHAAQCRINPEILLQVDYDDTQAFVNEARIMLTLQALEEGRVENARGFLAESVDVSSPDFWPAGSTSSELLIISFLRSCLDGTMNMRGDLEVMYRNFRYLNRQTLYYDAAYLLGKVDEKAYLAQPRKMDLAERWQFVQALACDLDGRCARARRLYTEILDAQLIVSDHSKRRFCAWRLTAIEPKKASRRRKQ